MVMDSVPYERPMKLFCPFSKFGTEARIEIYIPPGLPTSGGYHLQRSYGTDSIASKNIAHTRTIVRP